jgi:peptidoglycan/xylan/chitin deacetylase (PgdA/CDA1 family)
VSTLAITFDDGPDPRLTPRLLDLLDGLDARATFFPIASRAAAAPDLIRQVQTAGHTIGFHCHDHVRHSERERIWVQRDTHIGLELLDQVGVTPTLWRTPWGVTTDFSQDVADEHGLRIVGWTIDTHDWRGDTAEQMLAATGRAIGPGEIILAHDGIGPGATRDDATETLRYVELTARLAAQRGLRLGALNDCGDALNDRA